MGLNKNKNVSEIQYEVADLFQKIDYFNFSLSTLKDKNIQLSKGKNGFFNWGFIFQENQSNKPTTFFELKKRYLDLNQGILTIKGKIVDREDEEYKMSIEEDINDNNFGFLGYNQAGDNVIIEIKSKIQKQKSYYVAKVFVKVERQGKVYSLQYDSNHRVLQTNCLGDTFILKIFFAQLNFIKFSKQFKIFQFSNN